MIFEMEGIPPSYNRSVSINHNMKQVYLSDEARNYKKIVKLLCPHMDIPEGSKLSLSILVHSNKWFYKNGKVRKIDLQNMDKLLIDAVCEKLGVDDSHIWEFRSKKVISNENKTVVMVEVIEE